MSSRSIPLITQSVNLYFVIIYLSRFRFVRKSKIISYTRPFWRWVVILSTSRRTSSGFWWPLWSTVKPLLIIIIIISIRIVVVLLSAILKLRTIIIITIYVHQKSFIVPHCSSNQNHNLLYHCSSNRHLLVSLTTLDVLTFSAFVYNFHYSFATDLVVLQEQNESQSPEHAGAVCFYYPYLERFELCCSGETSTSYFLVPLPPLLFELLPPIINNFFFDLFY